MAGLLKLIKDKTYVLCLWLTFHIHLWLIDLLCRQLQYASLFPFFFLFVPLVLLHVFEFLSIDVAMNFTAVEVKVREATDPEESWGPTGSQMNEIAAVRALTPLHILTSPAYIQLWGVPRSDVHVVEAHSQGL
jgi:hypothetical protein